MNDGFRKHITDCTINDDNVLFYWSLAGQDEYDKTCECCLFKLVEKCVTIRGFSFAKNLLELYKQEEKRALERRNLFVVNSLHKIILYSHCMHIAY